MRHCSSGPIKLGIFDIYIPTLTRSNCLGLSASIFKWVFAIVFKITLFGYKISRSYEVGYPKPVGGFKTFKIVAKPDDNYSIITRPEPYFCYPTSSLVYSTMKGTYFHDFFCSKPTKKFQHHAPNMSKIDCYQLKATLGSVIACPAKAMGG